MNWLTQSVATGYHRASKLRALLVQPSYRRALHHRVAASVEHERTPLHHDYGTILDVGANRGQFALVAAHRFPQATIICFEPQTGPRDRLMRALAGHPRLRVLDVALAETAGVAVFHITHADDSSSLLPTTDLQVETFPGTHVTSRKTVSTQRLDAVVSASDLERPTLLKIDVQGTELEVLRGAAGVLEHIDAILVECSFVELYRGQALADDVLAFLHEQGFRLVSVVSPTIGDDGRVLQADMVFERPATPKP